MRVLPFLTICLLLLLAPIISEAQTFVELNSSNIGTLTDTQPQANFIFVGTANTSVDIEVISVSENLFPQVIILGADGSLLLIDDNSDQSDTIQTTVILPTTGNYTILVASGGIRGDFVLRLAASAGQECELYMETVMEQLATRCEQTARNELCYGNNQIQLSSVPGQVVNFTEPGDIVGIGAVQSLALSPLNDAENIWGIALMQIQANLPDTLPGQNVTMLVFGDVTIDNEALNTGRNPMQAFYFNTGIGQQSCANVEENGILIETPDGAGQVELTVNGVNLQIASTVYLQLNDDDPNQRTIDVNTVEGVVVIESQGGIQIAAEGSVVKVPANEEFRAIDVPNPPEDIQTQGLPVPVRDLVEVVPEATATPTLVPTQAQPEFVVITNTPPPAPPTTDPRSLFTPTPNLTATPEQPVLPVSGPCVLATFENGAVNVRSIPDLDNSEVVSLLSPAEIYTVIGRTQNSDWYQVSRGWVAEFVTRRGGNCGEVPITYTSPSPTPAFQIAGDNTYFVTVDYTQNGLQHVLRGNLSYPLGDRLDRVNYTVDFGTMPLGYNPPVFGITVFCSGSNISFYEIILPNGSVVPCPSFATDYDFTQQMIVTPGSITIRERSTPPEGTYITWGVDLGVYP